MDEYEDDDVFLTPVSIMIEVDFNIHFDYEKKYALLNVDRLNHAETCDTEIVLLENNESKTYPCHKSVLSNSFEYFETKYCKRRYRIVNTALSAPEDEPFTNSDTVEQLLRLAYTGKLQFSRSNAYDVYHDCVIFKFKHVTALWKIIYLRNYFHSRILDFLELFHQRCYRSQCWNDTIEYIAKNFHELRSREELLAPAIDKIQLLLDYLPERLNDDERVLDFVVRWGLCHRQRRAPFIPELLKNIRVKNVSGTFAKDLTVRLFKCNYSCHEQRRKNFVVDSETRSLRTFVHMRDEHRYHFFEYELLRSGEWRYATAEIVRRHSASKFVLVGDRIYNLSSATKTDAHDDEYMYSFRSTRICDYKKLFRVGSDYRTLRTPQPLIFSYIFHMSVLDTKIYAYFSAPARTKLYNEIRCYNREKNNWEPVFFQDEEYLPSRSTMISQGNLLYLLGGDEHLRSTKLPLNGQAMCYDSRVKGWIKLRDMKQTHSGGAACLYDGKIYVAGGRNCAGQPINVVEAFDPTAGKWRLVSSLNARRELFSLTPYNERLWALGNGLSLATEIYDPATDCWSIHDKSFVRARGDRILVDLWKPQYRYTDNEDVVTAFVTDSIAL